MPVEPRTSQVMSAWRICRRELHHESTYIRTFTEPRTYDARVISARMPRAVSGRCRNPKTYGRTSRSKQYLVKFPRAPTHRYVHFRVDVRMYVVNDEATPQRRPCSNVAPTHPRRSPDWSPIDRPATMTTTSTRIASFTYIRTSICKQAHAVALVRRGLAR